MGVLIGIGPSLILLWCLLSLFRRSSPGGWLLDLRRAVGWQALFALGAVLLQSVMAIVGWKSFSASWDDLPFMVPFSWWVLLGGASVQAVFEENVRSLTGHRTSTMMDNWHVYLAMTLLQVLAVALVLIWRRRSGDRAPTRDPVAWLVGIAVLVNGCLGAKWPWWGT